RRDDGLRRAAHQQHELADRALRAKAGGDRAPAGALPARLLLQVESGAERPPRAAQDQDAGLGVVRQLPEELPQLANEGRAHGIQRTWSVEREPGEVSLALEGEGFVHAPWFDAWPPAVKRLAHGPFRHVRLAAEPA